MQTSSSPRPNPRSGTILSPRTLNRALLARQFLVDRAQGDAVDVIEHLVGLQSQAPTPPYVGLWTRLDGFRADDLSRLLVEKQVVRIALMRSTIHLVSARDCLALRPVIQPVLERGLQSGYGRDLVGLDLVGIANAGRNLRPKPGAATLRIEPFDALSAGDVDGLTEEGTRLLAFAAAGESHDIQVVQPV